MTAEELRIFRREPHRATPILHCEDCGRRVRPGRRLREEDERLCHNPRCRHVWRPRLAAPRCCPRCKVKLLPPLTLPPNTCHWCGRTKTTAEPVAYQHDAVYPMTVED